MTTFYNRYLAAGYASRYALQYNKNWIADTDGLHEFRFPGAPFRRLAMTTGVRNNDSTAWYNLGEPDSFLGDSWGRSTPYKRSRSWASADNFMRFLKISGRARRCKISELKVGDVVQHFTVVRHTIP